MSKSVTEHYQELTALFGSKLAPEMHKKLEDILALGGTMLIAQRDMLEDMENRYVALSRYLRDQREKISSLPVLHD